MIFSDWDEIDCHDIRELNEKYSTFFNEPLQVNNLHDFLESGFIENTKVELEDGTIIPIEELEINNTQETIEAAFGKVDDPNDPCSKANLNINNTSVNIATEDLGQLGDDFDIDI